ncbi:MAG: transposase [Gammaproteobacteria bacterium]|jgi:IS4 transposase|nr:transposase [Gammaproteobacteria bacterium]
MGFVNQQLIVLTNLPADAADAATVAELNRSRWRIETAFQRLDVYHHSDKGLVPSVLPSEMLRSLQKMWL